MPVAVGPAPEGPVCEVLGVAQRELPRREGFAVLEVDQDAADA